MEQQEIKISKLLLNDGQLPDIPKNPRFIRDEAFEQLKQSIKDYPDMLAMRELVVVPYNDKYVVLGGNMRLRACRELGYKSLPCKVYPADTDPKVLRHFVLVDNKAYGEDDWDALANEWDEAELAEWGIEVPKMDEGDEKNPYAQNTDIPIYEIRGEEPAISECVDLTEVKEICNLIDKSGVSDEQKEMLKVCAYRFMEINFANMAEYYAHQDKEMQSLMERIALVIIDFDKAIENGLVVMDKRLKKIYENEI